jgi:hypothetical protein
LEGKRVFENRVLRTIFGPRRDEITGELRKLQNKILHNLHSSLNNMRPIGIKENEMDRVCGTHGSEQKVYIVWWESLNERTTRKTEPLIGLE